MMLRIKPKSSFAALLFLGLLLVPGSLSAAPVPIKIVGNEEIPTEELERALEQIPFAGEDLDKWTEFALLQLEELYVNRKYIYARIFSKVQKDGSLLIEVDEGKMHRIVFVGAGLLRGFMLQVDFDLPGRIYQQDRVEAALEKLKAKFRIYQVEEQVDESKHNRRPTKTGFLAPERTMRIFVRGKESFGWGWGLTIDAQTGITPNVRFNIADKFGKNDRIYGEAGFGLPYR